MADNVELVHDITLFLPDGERLTYEDCVSFYLTDVDTRVALIGFITGLGFQKMSSLPFLIYTHEPRQ